MALDPHEILQANKSLDDLAASPLGGTRRQRWQRLQVGVLGLGAMVLMVGLADIVTSSVAQNRAAMPEALPPVSNEDVPAPRDPLADAGVVPELPDPTPTPVITATPGGPLVPVQN
jgi:hypothetical protein